jgi:hypothetical protein
METGCILISLRDLRFGRGTNFGGDCRDYQRCHRQERDRCFIYVIIHDNLHSNPDAKGISAFYQGSKVAVRPGKVLADEGIHRSWVQGKDSVNCQVSDLGTVGGENGLNNGSAHYAHRTPRRRHDRRNPFSRSYSRSNRPSFFSMSRLSARTRRILSQTRQQGVSCYLLAVNIMFESRPNPFWMSHRAKPARCRASDNCAAVRKCRPSTVWLWPRRVAKRSQRSTC